MISDGSHIFCTSCRQHSFLCPCWYHGRFAVECGVLGGRHNHINVDLNFISTAERLAGGMLIRRKSSATNEGIQHTGDLNTLITWCVQQADFAALSVGKDMSVKIKTVDGNGVDLVTNDWVRVNDQGKLDRISASSFEANWEVI